MLLHASTSFYGKIETKTISCFFHELFSRYVIWRLTCSLVKYATTRGVMNPVDVAAKLINPYNVPAKLGAKSCAFWRFVIVELPLNPSDNEMIATHTYGFVPTNVKRIKNSPGIT